MTTHELLVQWPDGQISKVLEGTPWLDAAESEGYQICTGCLRGCCGVCEVEVNGQPCLACISAVYPSAKEVISIDFDISTS